MNLAVEFRQRCLAPPGLGLTEEGRVSTGKTEMHIYGKELGTMPGTVLSKGQLNLNLHFIYVSLKANSRPAI